MKYQWQLTSIFNLSKVRWKVIREVKARHSDDHYVLATVYLYGQNIDHRQGSYVVNCDEAYRGYMIMDYHESEIGLARDYRVNLSQVCLSANQLAKLYQVLIDWLNLPIAELPKQPLNFSIDLVEIKGQQLTISFDRLPHTSQISTQHLFKLTYVTSSLSGNLEFMVDHTCIQELIDGLKELINNLNPRVRVE